jgi:integrase
MPRQKRHKTHYPGVYYIIGTAARTGKPERIFYIQYRNHEGKLIEEKAGRQIQNDMTAARAAAIRGQRIKGDPSNTERRKAIRRMKEASANRWTFDRLWRQYVEQRYAGNPEPTDRTNYEKHISPLFAHKTSEELVPLDVDRLSRGLAKTLKPGTVAKVLGLLRRLINFGEKRQLCKGPGFRIQLPRVNDQKTEYLTEEQMARLLEVLGKHHDIQAANLVRMALFTGMRRGELFALRWEDIDFERGYIHIREPKGGADATIPLSAAAKAILKSHPRTDSPYVFPGRFGEKRTDAKNAMRSIRKAAGLPLDFRPFHGLRHSFASMLASSGQVDLYTLQKLLTHKSPLMTQRYAHLHDETLKRAAEVAGRILQGTAQGEGESKLTSKKSPS